MLGRCPTPGVWGVPTILVAIGCMLGWVVWGASGSFPSGLVVVGTFVGGSLATIGIVWWDRYRTQELEATILDSLRRTLIRQVKSFRMPDVINDLLQGGSMSLTLATPIDFVVDLRPTMELAARQISMDKLYSYLLALDQAVTHLRYLSWMDPLIRISPWGVAGVDPVSMEERVPPTSPHDSLARWRQHRILLTMQTHRADTELKVQAYCRAAVREIESVLTTDYPRYITTDDPALAPAFVDPRFQRVLELLQPPSPDSLRDLFGLLQREGERIRANWRDPEPPQ